MHAILGKFGLANLPKKPSSSSLDSDFSCRIGIIVIATHQDCGNLMVSRDCKLYAQAPRCAIYGACRLALTWYTGHHGMAAFIMARVANGLPHSVQANGSATATTLGA